MAYAEIASALKYPPGASDRYKRLDALDRLLDGTFYDDIAYAFEQEKLGEDYLSLTKRRPSVKYNLPRIVIDESSGSLWTDDEMAKIICGLPGAENPTKSQDQLNVDAIMLDCSLDAVMMELYERSASGSGAILVTTDADGMPAFEVVAGKYVRPIWATAQKLSALERVYPITARDLRAGGIQLGKDVSDDSAYWMRIVYTQDAEIRYAPLTAEKYEKLGVKPPDGEEPVRWVMADAYPHNWGVVRGIYVRNLLYGGNDVDGRCPYEVIADIQVEIDRLLSQVGRGLRYAADPLLVRDRGELESTSSALGSKRTLSAFGDVGESELRGPDGQTVRSASNVLYGEARLLEMTGAGLKMADDHIKLLREYALEVVGAMKADAATVKGAPMSGRAIDLLQQMLRLLVKRQRIAFGTRGLIELIRVLLTGCAAGQLIIPDVKNANAKARMHCQWPKYDQDTLAPILPVPEPNADNGPNALPAPTPAPKDPKLAA